MKEGFAVLLVLALPCWANEQSWQSCADNVRSWMWSRGQCGASDCLNEYGNLEQNIVKRCGYPKHTKAKMQTIVREAKRACRIEDNRAVMNSYLERQLEVFPPSHPIHKKVLDQCFRNK